MNGAICPPTANTGIPALALIGLGLLLLLVGVILLRSSRRRGGPVAATAALLLLIGAASTVGVTHASPARAAAPACGPRANPPSVTSSAPVGVGALAITQTSTLTGMAPGVAPKAITGTVRNVGAASTFLATVTVSITAVTAPAGAPKGSCDASDYVLLHAAMRVARTLAPGDSATFRGARIGFKGKPVNQDACQRAVVDLRYVSAS